MGCVSSTDVGLPASKKQENFAAAIPDQYETFGASLVA